MTTDMILIALVGLTLASYALSLVYVVGIVWRVELELDVAYKCLAFAVLFFGVAEVLDLVPRKDGSETWQLFTHGARFLAAILLFLGMYFMRDLVRKLDGEKPRRK